MKSTNGKKNIFLFVHLFNEKINKTDSKDYPQTEEHQLLFCTIVLICFMSFELFCKSTLNETNIYFLLWIYYDNLKEE